MTRPGRWVIPVGLSALTCPETPQEASQPSQLRPGLCFRSALLVARLGNCRRGASPYCLGPGCVEMHPFPAVSVRMSVSSGEGAPWPGKLPPLGFRLFFLYWRKPSLTRVMLLVAVGA